MNIILNYIARATAGIGTLISAITPLTAILAALCMLIVLSITQMIVYAVKISKNRKEIRRLEKKISTTKSKVLPKTLAPVDPEHSHLLEEIQKAVTDGLQSGRKADSALKLAKEEAPQVVDIVKTDGANPGPIAISQDSYNIAFEKPLKLNKFYWDAAIGFKFKNELPFDRALFDRNQNAYECISKASRDFIDMVANSDQPYAITTDVLGLDFNELTDISAQDLTKAFNDVESPWNPGRWAFTPAMHLLHYAQCNFYQRVINETADISNRSAVKIEEYTLPEDEFSGDVTKAQFKANVISYKDHQIVLDALDRMSTAEPSESLTTPSTFDIHKIVTTLWGDAYKDDLDNWCKAETFPSVTPLTADALSAFDSASNPSQDLDDLGFGNETKFSENSVYQIAGYDDATAVRSIAAAATNSRWLYSTVLAQECTKDQLTQLVKSCQRYSSIIENGLSPDIKANCIASVSDKAVSLFTNNPTNDQLDEIVEDSHKFKAMHSPEFEEHLKAECLKLLRAEIKKGLEECYAECKEEAYRNAVCKIIGTKSHPAIKMLGGFTSAPSTSPAAGL
ncbi:hypothetical protein MMH89_01735 [Candidatus Comchoanobacter bicostacola]|uniref:Uncharacterized protein n=1 Tax=Candidatus Comchoanobacter bicostacola TaxID=2919598 RepID=A0ABY5DK57_9GAMM|nr:hypothetical protein [Candidatus Comchoanobacter bicostacola]UTC24871.1 hypothetical protein MMH89_01735 [Candidatus Comchoanobacter bicostacola]